MIRPALRDIGIYLCVQSVDFRNQVNGLSMLAKSELSLYLLSSAVFAFTNRRRNRVKLLVWECNDFVLWLKRLEHERFCWPRSEEAVVRLSGQEFNWLLDGLDLASGARTGGRTTRWPAAASQGRRRRSR